MRVRFDSGSLMERGLEKEWLGLNVRELREWVVGRKGNKWSAVGMVR